MEFNAKKRKKDHLNLAMKSQTGIQMLDDRFIYEPLLKAHPLKSENGFTFLGKKMNHPIWISSMTGGTEYAGHINRNLARACAEFGLGMGLGSCRVLLEDNAYFDHFDLRDIIGPDRPFYANLGISQIEYHLKHGSVEKIIEMTERLRVDGLIIHVNPIQEWLQPEGDEINVAPLETIKAFLEQTKVNTIVKEVGQGMGYESLKALMKLPLQAIEFGAFGGTNFAKIEMERNDIPRQELLEPLCYIGNDAYAMTSYVNRIIREESDILCKELIISGGIKSYLDGYFYRKICALPSIYGQASAFLNHAREEYEQLKEYVESHLKGYSIAENYLKINPDYIQE